MKEEKTEVGVGGRNREEDNGVRGQKSEPADEEHERERQARVAVDPRRGAGQPHALARGDGWR